MTKKRYKIQDTRYKRGDVLLSVIVFSAIAVTITIALVNWGALLLTSVRSVAAREQALQIAEAGIDYYRWHLAHSPVDYKDGTCATVCSNGPYTHQFTDKDGTVIGAYQLTITPPLNGSTLVTIVSKGTVTSNASLSRTLKVTMGMASWAQYSVVANDNMNFGSGTVIYGPVHSNYGIHFEGTSYGLMTSGLTQYTDLDVGTVQYAVYTNANGLPDPTPPTAIDLTRHSFGGAGTTMFYAGRKLAVPTVDFTALNNTLANLKTAAIGSSSYYGTTTSLGYHFVLNTNNTYDVYKVTALVPAPNNCSNSTQSRWGTWSILTQTSYQTAVVIPSSGVIYAEADVWVDGTVNGTRLTIGAGILPDPGSASWPSITINSDLKYTNYDGTDSIGLIAQGNVNVGLKSASTLNIDAALIAENGRVGRYSYTSSCGTEYLRTTLNLRGTIGTATRYGFAYGSPTVVSGYQSRNLTYDTNLLYSPPPSFPVTSSTYVTLSWQEI